MDVETLNFGQLIELLDDLAERRTPVGWTPDDAVIKSSVERRIIELVMSAPDEERRRTERVPCNMPIALRAKDRSIQANVVSLGAGGAFVQCDSDLPIGTHVHLQVETASQERGLRARGQIAWRESEPMSGVGVSFADQPSAPHERRLRRFVLETLRHRTD